MSDTDISYLNDDELRLVMEHIPTEWDRMQFAQSIGRDEVNPQIVRKTFMREMRDVRSSRSEKFKSFLHFLQHVLPSLQPVHHGSKIVRLKIAESYGELHEIMLEPISGALQGTPQQQMLNFMHLFAALSTQFDLVYSYSVGCLGFMFKKKTPVPYNDPAWSSGSNLKAEYTYRLNITESCRISFEFNIKYSGGDFFGEPLPHDKHNWIAFQINPDDVKPFTAENVFFKIRTCWRNQWPGLKAALKFGKLHADEYAKRKEFFHTITKMLVDDIKADKWTLHIGDTITPSNRMGFATPVGNVPAVTDSEAFAKQITQIIVDSKLIFTEEYRPSGGAAEGGGMLLAPFLDRTLLQ